MLSLIDYNIKRQQQILESEATMPLSGVLCPECLRDDKEVELHQETNWVLLSNPPQIHVWCSDCNFEGHKLA